MKASLAYATEIMNKIFSIDEKHRGMVFNATFNNISAISWQLVLLMKETNCVCF
jgi:hypothetical protein